MKQEINAKIRMTTTLLGFNEDIERGVLKFFSGNFIVNSINLDESNSSTIIEMDITTEADASLGPSEIIEELVNILESSPFNSIKNVILSLREEAEIYGNV